MTRRNKCGKRLYRSFEKAQKALLKVQNTYDGPEVKKPKRAYYCQRCHGYHLTSREY